MKKRKLQITLMDIVYENGKGSVQSFTKKELAGWRRSNDFKKVLSQKKLCLIDIEIRMPK
jgi:hypothetical protein